MTGELEPERAAVSAHVLQVRYMKRQIKVFSLAFVLVAGSISQIACGNATTLDKVGRVAVNLAQGLADQIAALEAGGLDSAKLVRLRQSSAAFTASAKALKDYLDGLKDVNQKDSAAITQQIAKAVNIANALLQNPDVFGLGENSTLVKTLRYTGIALNQLSLTLTVFFPPPPPGAVSASSAGGKTVAVAKIKIDFPDPPPEVKAMLNR